MTSGGNKSVNPAQIEPRSKLPKIENVMVMQRVRILYCEIE